MADLYSEELLPGVWINRTQVWRSADEALATFAESDFDPDPELDDRGDQIKGNGKRLPFPEWHRDAACLGREEQMFFGSQDTSERPAVSMSDVARAKAVCAGCPVFRTCLSTALGLVGENREEYGIWAGTSGRTRKRIWELVERGEVDLQEVVDDVCKGQGDRYERSAVLVQVAVVTPLKRIAIDQAAEAVA